MALFNSYPMNYPYYGVQNFGQYQSGVQNLGQYQPNQIQNGGFIPVASETDARNYPVAPGNSVTFKDDKLPYVYVKTMGFSQLDRPVFEKYRLVKEQDAQITNENTAKTDSLKENDNLYTYDAKSEIEALQRDLEAFKQRVEELENDIADLRLKISDFFSKKPVRKKNEPESNNADA